jgi:hypothetical protein
LMVRCLGCGDVTTSRQPDTEMWCTVPAPPISETTSREEEPQVVPQAPATSGNTFSLPQP